MPQARLGELLVKAGLLSEEKLAAALKEQERAGVRLGQILVDHRIVDEQDLYDVLARLSGLDRLDLTVAGLDPKAMRWVTEAWATEHSVAPLGIDMAHRTLKVAVSDPTNVGALDELSFRSGLKVTAVLGTEHEVQGILRHHFHGEPLEAVPRRRRSAPAPVEVAPGEPGSEPEILHDMNELRDDLFGLGSKPPAPARAAPRPAAIVPADGEPRGAYAAQLSALLDVQDASALELQALFELCVERGIIKRHEYLERLSKMND